MVLFLATGMIYIAPMVVLWSRQLVFDRYLLLLVPLATLLLVQSSATHELAETGYRFSVPAVVTLALFGVFSVAGTHDYLSWNRVRWQALNNLMQEQHVSPKQMDGGVEFNAWYLYSRSYPNPLLSVDIDWNKKPESMERKPAPTKSWWWVASDDYVVTFGPVPGFTELKRYPFQRWLPPGEGSVLILQRTSADGYTQPSTPRTYATRFPTTETPISENRNWVNGGSCDDPALCAGAGGSNVRTTPGLAFGTQTGALPPPYTDSNVLLTGMWGNDQFVQIVVWWDGASGTNSDYDEVEIRLRGTLTANGNRTYNINCRVGTPSDNSYIQMGRANGPSGDFTPPLAELKGPSAACQNGDVITGTIVGSVITAYINGKKVIQATDSVITSGVPGFGFFHQGKHGHNSNFGISSFAASDRFPRFGVQGQGERPNPPQT